MAAWLNRLLPGVELEGHLIPNADPKGAALAGHPEAVVA
jgi:hypothetical protein